MDNQHEVLPRLLTAQEVADAIGISAARIYELARQDRIPYVKIGKSVRFIPERVAEWIAAGGERQEQEPTRVCFEKGSLERYARPDED